METTMEKTTKNPEEKGKEWLKRGPLSEEEKETLKRLRREQVSARAELLEEKRDILQALQFREEHCKGLTAEEDREYQELLPFTREATARKAGEWTPEDAKKLQRFYQLAEKRKGK
jgi:hypothetical protein